MTRNKHMRSDRATSVVQTTIMYPITGVSAVMSKSAYRPAGREPSTRLQSSPPLRNKSRARVLGASTLEGSWQPIRPSRPSFTKGAPESRAVALGCDTKRRHSRYFPILRALFEFCYYFCFDRRAASAQEVSFLLYASAGAIAARQSPCVTITGLCGCVALVLRGSICHLVNFSARTVDRKRPTSRSALTNFMRLTSRINAATSKLGSSSRWSRQSGTASASRTRNGHAGKPASRQVLYKRSMSNEITEIHCCSAGCEMTSGSKGSPRLAP